VESSPSTQVELQWLSTTFRSTYWDNSKPVERRLVQLDQVLLLQEDCSFIKIDADLAALASP
jgi:hypothetical protein